jgi:hypothetical protein
MPNARAKRQRVVAAASIRFCGRRSLRDRVLRILRPGERREILTFVGSLPEELRNAFLSRAVHRIAARLQSSSRSSPKLEAELRRVILEGP